MEERMTQREQIDALQKEVAELREQLATTVDAVTRDIHGLRVAMDRGPLFTDSARPEGVIEVKLDGRELARAVRPHLDRHLARQVAMIPRSSLVTGGVN